MNSKIFNSRSFSRNITRSDHKPVIAKIQIKLTYTKKAIQNTQTSENYIKHVNEIIR